jgi:hypothetical protein
MDRKTYTASERLEILASVYRLVGHGYSERRACGRVRVPQPTVNRWKNQQADRRHLRKGLAAQ